MKKRTSVEWIVLGLCLLSFARGAYELGEQSLWWDESLSHYRASKPFPFILSNRMYFLNGTDEIPVPPDNHPPLYFVLLRVVLLTAGDSEFVLRFISLAAGVLLVPLLYRCGLDLYGPASGALAALLGAFSPLYLWAQQEARPYALGTMLGAASFYTLIRLLYRRSERDSSLDAVSQPHLAPGHVTWWESIGSVLERGEVKWGAAYLVATLALLATHYLGLLLLPPQAIMALLAQKRRFRRLRWAILIVGIVGVGILVSGLSSVLSRATIPGFDYIPLQVLLEDVFRSFPLGVSGTQLTLFQWVGVGLLLAASAVLLTTGWRGEAWRPAAYLGLCFLLPVGEIYVLSFVRPAYMNIRHLIFASPFYYLLLAGGVAQVWRLGVRIGQPQTLLVGAFSAPLAVAFVVLLAGMALSTRTYYGTFRKEDHRGWGRFLSDHVRPDDLVLINPGPIAELYFYYVESEASYYGFPLMYQTEEGTIAQLREVISGYDRVWVAQSLTPHWANPSNITLRWLQDNAHQIAFADFHSDTTTVQAHAFRLQLPLLADVPERAQSVALSFGDRLRLLGLSSPMDQVVSGHTLQLSLYWSPTRPLDRQYRVTLSLTDSAGFSWASLDYVPTVGSYHAQQWPTDQIVQDDVDLDLPPGVPPGQYRLNVSVYPADGSEPALPVYTLSDRTLLGLIVPIGQFQVVLPKRPPSEEELPIDYPTRWQYGGDLILLGHNFDGGTYQPGDVLRVDAYWRALRAPQRDPVYLLQLVDGGGQVHAGRSIQPSEGYSPQRWRKGEVVKARYRFHVPPDVAPGQYVLSLTSDEGESSLGLHWPWVQRSVALNAIVVQEPGSDRSFQVPDMQHPVGVVLGDRVELLGFDLGSETVRAGEVVSCTLYWRALEAMNQNYTVFNHLVAPDGQTWGQWDNQPQKGNAPTTRWVPGQVIADPYQIPVSADAPAGRLELRSGMYDRLTMLRLSMYDDEGNVAGDSVRLTEVEVIRP